MTAEIQQPIQPFVGLEIDVNALKEKPFTAKLSLMQQAVAIGDYSSFLHIFKAMNPVAKNQLPHIADLATQIGDTELLLFLQMNLHGSFTLEDIRQQIVCMRNHADRVEKTGLVDCDPQAARETADIWEESLNTGIPVAKVRELYKKRQVAEREARESLHPETKEDVA
jgi:hypothetical protein